MAKLHTHRRRDRQTNIKFVFFFFYIFGGVAVVAADASLVLFLRQ